MGMSGRGCSVLLGQGGRGEVVVCGEREAVRVLWGLNTGSVVGDMEPSSGCWCGWRVTSLCVRRPLLPYMFVRDGEDNSDVCAEMLLLGLLVLGDRQKEGAQSGEAGGTWVPWRDVCRLCVCGETGLLVPHVLRGMFPPSFGELWGCELPLLHVSVCTCGGRSPREPLRQRLEVLRLGLAVGKVFRGSRGWSWNG